MKKLFGLLTFMILFVAVTCENEPLEGDFVADTQLSCETAIINTADAALAFVSVTEENYTQLCTTYRSALLAQIETCGDNNGSLQAAVDALGDCTNDNLPDDCASATAAVGVAETAFNSATAETYTQLCNVYRATLENVIELCGANAEIQSEIDALGDCSNDQNSEVAGTWLLTAWIGEEGLDLNNDGEASLNFLDEMDCYNNETLVLNEDGTAVSTTNSYAEIEYTIEVGTEDSFIFTVNCIDETEISNGTWTQSGNIVTISDEFGDSADWVLDGNELSIYVPSGFVSFSEDGTATTSQDLTFVFTKQ